MGFREFYNEDNDKQINFTDAFSTQFYLTNNIRHIFRKLEAAKLKTDDDIKREGVIWLVNGVIGISYCVVEDSTGEVIKSAEVCFRFLSQDVICQKITIQKPRVTLSANILVAKANIDVFLENNCLMWEGKACYILFDRYPRLHEVRKNLDEIITKWQCVKGSGKIICTDKKEEVVE